MYIVVRKKDHIVISNETALPPEGAYNSALFEIKWWAGAPPQIEAPGVRGDIDPLLDAAYDVRRLAEYIAGGLTMRDMLDLLYDDILPELRSLLPSGVVNKLDERLIKRQAIKDKHPKLNDKE